MVRLVNKRYYCSFRAVCVPCERKGTQETIIQGLISFNVEAISLREHPVFFGFVGRGATTGNTSVVRRLGSNWLCAGLDWQENVSECEYELCSFLTYKRENAAESLKYEKCQPWALLKEVKDLREKSICLRALHKSSEDHKAGLTYIVLKKIKEHAWFTKERAMYT